MFLTSCKQALDSVFDLYFRCVHFVNQEYTKNFSDNMELHTSQ